MDFGKNILSKFGWKEGEGLGREKQGIIQPVRATSNHENKGLGHHLGTELNNHWWERVFNESSNNLTVSKDTDQVTFDVKDKDGVEITAKSYSIRKLKEKNINMTYGSFLRSATLLADVGKEQDISDHIKTEDFELDNKKTVTDEQLFKACGGRTAHKGARHGLNLTGKLSRVAEQDAILLEKFRSGANATEIFANSRDFTTVKSKKKKNKCQPKKSVDLDLEPHPEEELDELSEILNNNNEPKLSSRKKKRNRKLDSELSENIFSALQNEELSDEPQPSTSKWQSKKKKGKKGKESSTLHELKTTIKKKPKKVKNKLMKTEITAQQASDYLKDNLITSKQLKKMKHKGKIIETPKPTEPDTSISRKRKLKCDSETESDSNGEDIVEKINQEQNKLQRQLKHGKQQLKGGPATEFESERAVVSKKTKSGNKKKSKKRDKYVGNLITTFIEQLSTQNSDDDEEIL